jgi:parallel beta-helix repeat protein
LQPLQATEREIKNMTTVTVNSSAGLSTALASAQAGETILLAPGTYSGLGIDGINPTGTVTIESQNSSQQAVLTNFSMANSSNLTFQNLELSTVNSTDPYYAFRVGSCSNIQFNSLNVQGVLGADAATVSNSNCAFLIASCSNVSVTNSTFQYVQIGMFEENNNGIVISGNTFSHLAVDGIDNAGSSNVQILNNYFTDTLANTIGGHPDCIQFWTDGTTSSAENITISGNTYVRGTGIASQGIFIGDDVGNLPFINLSITNNTISGGDYQGIAVVGAKNLTMSGNTLTGYTDQPSWIEVESINGGTLTNNAATSWIVSGDTNLTQTNDTTIPLAPVPTNSPVSGTGTVTVTSTTTAPAQPPAAPTGLVLDASTATGAAGSNITKDAQVVIDGSAAGGATVTLYDGTTVIGTGVANATTGAFSIEASAPLANGTHSLTAIATVSGQAGAASSALSVIVDTQPATAAFTHASGTGSTVTLTGTASDAVSGVGYTVSIFQDGTQIGTATPTNGAWTFTEKNVPNAVETYTVSTTDAAGNKGAGSNEVILGTSGNDHIVGGAGNNLIVGGLGTDTLTGGSGTNTFIYNTVNDAPLATKPETITNWVSGSDHIDLTALGALTFGGETQKVAVDTVDWYVSGGNTYIEAATTGHAKPDIMIELIGVHSLSASDFVLN